ncbi:putative carboxylic acid transport protein JEN1 [Microstroma glucosiphilum]|uniref:Putative carboxylic acid transport protein JEN1 n=1 Tax=Pseudomicrostroma glucosiphilum TaxID=1684307 RepID=A0A316U5Q7_9BASI|nr:putative carboxylic acid transport protein JEN1 [Pseudomicrostroma glucosiphilum]PWN20530.1 putative carboxylic acid transport protein JEN1 [Pseudomicrostroma glucosiphilum]
MSTTVQNVKESVVALFHWRTRGYYLDAEGVQRETCETPKLPPNPLKLIRKITLRIWITYTIGFLAWFADAYDFHSLSIQSVKLAKHFNTTKSQVSEAITLTLLLRSVGAAIFGIFADYFGRKYPMVINMWLLGALQIGTIYSQTFQQFLAVRALFGLAMGGVYGAAASMALESVPSDARGLMSGIFQQGYSLGYVIAACINLAVGGDVASWQTMFWVGAALSFFVGTLRLICPESKEFTESRKLNKGQGTADFRKNFLLMLKTEWGICVYAVVLMTWLCWISHTSQDSYTTFMIVGKSLSNSAASRTSILMKSGACIGGAITGYLSQWCGRRRAMVITALLTICLIPAWILPNSEAGLSVGSFLLQMNVQGAWGVVPIYLAEISPPAFRALFIGVTYQLGNAISSPSTQIVNELAERHHIKDHLGRQVEAYGPVMAIMTAIFAGLLVVTAAVGPEKKGISLQRGLAEDTGQAVRDTSVKGGGLPFPRTETANDSKSFELRRDVTGRTELPSKVV